MTPLICFRRKKTNFVWILLCCSCNFIPCANISNVDHHCFQVMMHWLFFLALSHSLLDLLCLRVYLWCYLARMWKNGIVEVFCSTFTMAIAGGHLDFGMSSYILISPPHFIPTQPSMASYIIVLIKISRLIIILKYTFEWAERPRCFGKQGSSW